MNKYNFFSPKVHHEARIMVHLSSIYISVIGNMLFVNNPRKSLVSSNSTAHGV
jgi:hypothetical protein